MLVLVDDCKRFTWVYFMKEKSEVFSRFKEFKVAMESVLNKKMNMFQTDNGREFTSINFHNFCQEHRIRRELLCAYTSQQNGVAEKIKDPTFGGDLQELALCKELTQSLMGGGYGMCCLCD
jgi:transposase InsO family protein